MAEAQPCRLAGKPARCAPPEKAFAFFEISPAEFFFFKVKAVSVGSLSLLATLGDLSPVDKL